KILRSKNISSVNLGSNNLKQLSMKKTIEDFEEANIGNLRKKFNDSATKEGFNLTNNLDKKVDIDFTQDIINEIVLWKVNRYVTINDSEWIKDFNELKYIEDLETNEKQIRNILEKMLKTHGIRLPMASTMLRFRNPKVFQIIDERTFRIIFGNNLEMRKKYDAYNVSDRIGAYFEYLKKLRLDCKKKNIEFSEADRILYQYDIEENKNFTKSKKE